MISVSKDVFVDGLKPSESLKDLETLFILMTGKRSNPSEKGKILLTGFLHLVQDRSPRDMVLDHAQFNEILLLLCQKRVSEAFFNYFFMSDLCVENGTRGGVRFSKISQGIQKFRAYAMLGFGSFLTAYNYLSGMNTEEEILNALSPWAENSDQLSNEFKTRLRPITPITATRHHISRDNTWFTGYLTLGFLRKDTDTFEAQLELFEEAQNESQDYVELKAEQEIESLREELKELTSRQRDTWNTAIENAYRYLTWDYLDVYVATSMRERCDFYEAYDLIDEVFNKCLNDMSTIRWFDPTQALLESSPDKGLLEGLMLKRAECTLYMIQESDTLGKDSELASTLAQGKPVVAYVPRISEQQLKNNAGIISKSRPLEYLQSKIYTILGSSVLQDRDQIKVLREKLRVFDIVNEDIITIRARLRKFVSELEEYISENKKYFLLQSQEVESKFREENSRRVEFVAKVLAACQATMYDNRAEMLLGKHPLRLQVHLETGVANGVLVARTPEECAMLLKGILLKSLEFSISKFPFDKAIEEASASVLVEKQTRSCFRIVTNDSDLTNSFWNFYLTQQGRKEKR